ncbi:MAG: DUF3568 family protein [Verrucomicrobiota bacterium]
MKGFALFFPTFLSGCAVMTVGALLTTVQFFEGELRAEFSERTMEEVVHALKEVMEKDDWQVTDQRGDEDRAILKASTALGERVEVQLIQSTSARSIQVGIRVGAGDEVASREILRRILEEL